MVKGSSIGLARLGGNCSVLKDASGVLDASIHSAIHLLLPETVNSDIHTNASDREGQLVAKAQEGDSAAFGELMRRTVPASLSRANSILRNHELAEEEVQNAYLSAWRHLDQFEGKAKFTTWMDRIVTNQCLMKLRSLRRTCFTSLDQTPDTNGTARPRDS